jgi:uncharacterized protein (DUF3820 family)
LKTFQQQDFPVRDVFDSYLKTFQQQDFPVRDVSLILILKKF